MPESHNDHEQLDVLLSKVVEERITPEEISELEAMLDLQPEAQRRYVHYLSLHAELEHSSPSPSDNLPVGVGSLRGWVVGMAAALVGLLVATMVWWGPRSMDEAPLPMARVVDFDGSIRWLGSSGATGDNLKVGMPLFGGTLETTGADSWIEIAFHDGTSVTASGAASVSLSEGNAGKRIYVKHGDFSIRAAPQPAGAPLRVVTPSAELEVLGTQFNVGVDPLYTKLDVNEGRVRVQRLADGRKQEVVAGEQLLAGLETGTSFEVQARPNECRSWTSALPQDMKLGHWRPVANGREGHVHAEANLWLENHDDPQLHYSVVIGPKGMAQGLPRLGEGTVIRYRGQLDRSHRVLFGFTANHVGGGFAGKYFVWLPVDLSESSGGQFDLSVPMARYAAGKSCFPDSPIGLELQQCWIVTVNEDVGLGIESIEIMEQ